jgi:hypothetical protein
MKRSTLECRTLFVLMVVFLTGTVALAGSIPNTLNYQGALTGSAGKPVTAIVQPVTFKLYTSALGGAAFWTEPQTVPVTNGQFSAVLGNTFPLPTDKFTGNTYIGLTVGNGSEMLPRQKMTSVAYALKAADAIPKGVIVMWSGAVGQIPEGWALCDGVERSLPDGGTVMPPNLKDRFIVGVGNLYNPGNTGGSSIMNLTHSHTVDSHTHSGVDHLHNFSGTTGVSNANTNITDNQQDQKNMANIDHGHSFSGTTGAADRNLTSGATSPGTNSQLSGTQPSLPPYYALAFIMKL